MYKATEKFKTLNRTNSHAGLSKIEYDRLLYGEVVECSPPERLVKEGYLKKVARKKEASDGD